MLKRLLLLIPLAFACVALDAKPESLFLDTEDNSQILVNNRILAKINGKPISVFDLVKKMDILFYREYPEYVSSNNARYQFYKVNWKHVLQDLISKELVLADAEENKFQVNNGDVRQEMEALFGPNVIGNLDKVGMTFEEAWKIVHGDITIRRMIYVRVHNKAMKQVTPQNVKDAYEKYAQEHAQPQQWTYQLVSIRHKNDLKGSEVAKKAYEMLTVDNLALAELPAKLKGPKGVTINVSEEYVHRDNEMSDAYREILAKLKPREYSLPVAQKSRADQGTVHRIFCLKDVKAGGKPSFAECSNDIKDNLLNQAVDVETDLYLKKLRRHFAVKENVLKEMIPDDFQPFILKVSRL